MNGLLLFSTGVLLGVLAAVIAVAVIAVRMDKQKKEASK